eukprot:TRINITY_DN1969_c0_g1_i1.p1 TRINITY_DN1969_c0_g1~~TRINITY_DN1969_c0_g1_i1.p1  ORF type:complete len:393 (+),score=71.13 TRINITY_DN1969_c0_g1_i1:58-1179(+)
MNQDEEFDYMRRASLPDVVEAILARVVTSQPEDLHTYISAVAYAVKVDSQVGKVQGAWPTGGVPAAVLEKNLLKTLEFDVFEYDNDTLLLCVEEIFKDVTRELSIPQNTLRTFLSVVRENYSSTVPFHNYKHAVAVTQQAFCLLDMCSLTTKFEATEILALLTSCYCHDVNHPGLNNTYQKNAMTPLAVRYNDVSVLENYHCSCAFDILSHSSCDIVGSLSGAQAKRRFREIVVGLILATDVSLHKQHYQSLDSLKGGIKWDDAGHRLTILKNIMMMADLNNESRSFEFSQKWGPLVQEEFYKQGDREREEHLPVAPMMERTAQVEKEQQGFIKYLCLPLYEANAELFPELVVCVDNLKNNIESWKLKEKERE